MYIIGITGGTGAGKTSAVKALQALGAQALDCDEIYHELLLSNAGMKTELNEQFADVSTDGEIDRRKLGEIVWNNPDSLQKLNNITHKYMNCEIDKRISSLLSQGVAVTAIDAIALIESGQNKKCDIVIGVVAPKEKRISRIMQRDNLTKERAIMRINAQQQESFYRENCNHVLVNLYDTASEFEDKCIEFFKTFESQWLPENN